METEIIYAFNYDKPELTDDFLEHHGILKQKWGIRNGPPYPLNREGKEEFARNNLGKRRETGKPQDKPKSRHEERVEARHKKKVAKKRMESLAKARAKRQENINAAKAKKEAEDRSVREAEERAKRDLLEREERQREVEENERQINEFKDRVKRTGDIHAANEHSDLFSTDEINQIINKYDANRKLSALSNPEPEKRDFYKTAQKIANYAEVTKNTVNSLKGIYDVYNQFTNAQSQKAQNAQNAQLQNLKNQITSTRNLKEAYKHRNLFTKDELENLMQTVDKDDKLREYIYDRESKKNLSGKDVDLFKNQDKQQAQKQQNQPQQLQPIQTKPRAQQPVQNQPQNKGLFGKKENPPKQNQSQQKPKSQQVTKEQKRLIDQGRRYDNQQLNRLNNLAKIEADRADRERRYNQPSGTDHFSSWSTESLESFVKNARKMGSDKTRSFGYDQSAVSAAEKLIKDRKKRR